MFGNILVAVGAFAIGYWTVTFIAKRKIRSTLLDNIKYARVRIEWDSDCVTYRNLPYWDERTLELGLNLCSTLSSRVEGDGIGKKVVSDKVKCVTVVHENWVQNT